MYDVVTDKRVPKKIRQAPWPRIAQEACVDLPVTRQTRSNAAGKGPLQDRSIADAMRDNHDVGTYVMEEEKEVKPEHAIGRKIWTADQRSRRPENKDWDKTAWCNEFYYGIGHENTRTIKRPRGKKWKNHRMNVQIKKKTERDTKGQAREESAEDIYSAFVAMWKGGRIFIPYKVANRVGKITIKVWREQILPKLAPILIANDLTLYIDKDSAHTSETTQRTMREMGVKFDFLPTGSPDLSICESMANPIKHLFFNRVTEDFEKGFQRFKKIWTDHVSQEMINRQYKRYLDRFDELEDRGGQMTHW